MGSYSLKGRSRWTFDHRLSVIEGYSTELAYIGLVLANVELAISTRLPGFLPLYCVATLRDFRGDPEPKSVRQRLSARNTMPLSSKEVHR